MLVSIIWAVNGTVTGDVYWTVEFERVQIGITSLATDSFGPATGVATAAAAINIATSTAITCTTGANIDNLAAGEALRLRVSRDPTNVLDTLTGEGEPYMQSVRVVEI